MADTRISPREDRRVTRTRTALRNAFYRLILERGYEGMAAADVAALADVGRSTFYEHYSGLDDLLTQSLEPAFGALSQGALAAQPDPALTAVLEHFWGNRKVGATLLAGEAARVLQRLLAERFEAALAAGWPCPDRELAARRKVLALQLAAGQLAALAAWLSGRLPGTAVELAETLRRGAHAAAVASFTP